MRFSGKTDDIQPSVIEISFYIFHIDVVYRTRRRNDVDGTAAGCCEVIAVYGCNDGRSIGNGLDGTVAAYRSHFGIAATPPYSFVGCIGRQSFGSDFYLFTRLQRIGFDRRISCWAG